MPHQIGKNNTTPNADSITSVYANSVNDAAIIISFNIRSVSILMLRTTKTKPTINNMLIYNISSGYSITLVNKLVCSS